MMNNPKYITVAVVAVLFLFTGIAFGQWPDDSQQALLRSLLLNEAEMVSGERVRYRWNEPPSRNLLNAPIPTSRDNPPGSTALGTNLVKSLLKIFAEPVQCQHN